MSDYIIWIAVGVVLLIYLYFQYKKKKEQPKQGNVQLEKSFWDTNKYYIVLGIICVAIIVYFIIHNNQQENKRLALSEATLLSQNDTFSSMIINTDENGNSFIELTIADSIENISVNDVDNESIILKKGYKVDVNIGTLDLVGLIDSGFKLPAIYSQEQYIAPYDWTRLLSPLILLLVIVVVYYFYGGFGKNAGQLYKKEANDISFNDIGGLSEIKDDLKEVVGFIKNRSYYERVGARVPKGILLEGLSGVGKTMLAKAIATEASVPFYYSTGSEFHDMWVGMASRRVKSLFKKASKTNSVVFIDEFDSIAHKRSYGTTDVSREWNHTLNQLLAEMDGFRANTKIMVIAATNRVDVLDPAVLRAGRFDRKIYVPMPNYNDRIEILSIYIKNKRIADDVDIKSIAKQTYNFNGADIDLLVNEAAMIAGKGNKDIISMEDFNKAIDKMMVGEERKNINRTKEENKIIAYHEAGHGIIANLMPNGEKVEKISILQHIKSSGFTRMSQETEPTVMPKSKLLRSITVLLSGRVSEEIISQDITSGASDDIKKANELAREMVEHYGMSEGFGLRYSLKNDVGLNVISNDTAKIVDEEVNNILNNCHNQAKKILEDNRNILDKVANKLLEVETINGKELKELMSSGI